MAQDLLRGRVRCAVPNPGPVAVGSTITLGAAQLGYKSFLAAFGAAKSSYFVLADGAGLAIEGVWTVNAGATETATITEILWNDRLQSTAGETFASNCTAWCTIPFSEMPIIRSGPLAGFRNLLTNANPMINQRGYVSGSATIVANQYTLDRWRVVTSGQAVSWADSAGVRTVTAPAGGVEQAIESASILAGVHTLSWQGTAVALVNGAAVAKGGQVSLPGNANAVVRFSAGTFSLPQLEPGPLATPFERRPVGIEIALCERFCAIYAAVVSGNGVSPGTSMFTGMPHRTEMRVIPTLAMIAASFNTNMLAVSLSPVSTVDSVINYTNNLAGNCSIVTRFIADAEI